MSTSNIRKGDGVLLDSGVVSVSSLVTAFQRLIGLAGDGRQGYSSLAPFDAIHVGAASDGVHDMSTSQFRISDAVAVSAQSWGEVDIASDWH